MTVTFFSKQPRLGNGMELITIIDKHGVYERGRDDGYEKGSGEMKRPIGISIFAGLALVIGTMAVFAAGAGMIRLMSYSTSVHAIAYFIVVGEAVTGIGFIAVGFLLFSLKKAGRVLFLVLMVFFALFGLVYLRNSLILTYPGESPAQGILLFGACFVLPAALAFYYFSLPGVKERLRG